MIEFNLIELAIFGVGCLIFGNIAITASIWTWNRIIDWGDGKEKQIWGYKGQSKWQDMRLQTGSRPLSKTAHLGKGGRDS